MYNIAILASGSGSNALKLIAHFSQSKTAKVKLLASDNPEAGILQKVNQEEIPVFVWEKAQYRDGEYLSDFFRSQQIDYILLAGYLKLIPAALVAAYPKRIINIHPSLLPKFGGKGMYGMKVHQAVITAGEKVSGMSIHYVNEHYDEGGIIFQDSVPVLPEMSAEELQKAVLTLEHQHFAPVVEAVMKGER